MIMSFNQSILKIIAKLNSLHKKLIQMEKFTRTKDFSVMIRIKIWVFFEYFTVRDISPLIN